MAAITGAVIGGLALANSVYQGQQQAGAAKDALNAQKNAASASLAAQQANLKAATGNLQPFINSGQSALTQLSAVNSGDYSGFQNSPDYLYALQQGLQGADRGASARGALYSGGTTVDEMKTAEGLASQNLGNYRSNLMQLAQLGAGAGSNLGAIGTGNANAVSGINQNLATGTTNAGYNLANANSNTAGNVSSVLGQLWGQYGNSITPNTTAANSSSYSIAPMQNSFNAPNYAGPGSLSTVGYTPSYLTGA